MDQCEYREEGVSAQRPKQVFQCAGPGLDRVTYKWAVCIELQIFFTRKRFPCFLSSLLIKPSPGAQHEQGPTSKLEFISVNEANYQLFGASCEPKSRPEAGRRYEVTATQGGFKPELETKLGFQTRSAVVPKPVSGFQPVLERRPVNLQISTAEGYFPQNQSKQHMICRLVENPAKKDTDGALKHWLLDTLENLGNKQLKYFQWYLQNADESADGFVPLKRSHLEKADRLDTVDLMVQMYHTNTREVTEKILKKINRNKEKTSRDVVHCDESTRSTTTADAIVCSQQKIKCKLKRRFQRVFEGIAKAGNRTPLNQIFTQLCIIKGGTAEVNDEHEVRQIEAASRKQDILETTIRHEDIFILPPGRDEPIRTVMTKGVAGIGKTVLTQKFILDWAEDKTNQEIQFLFPFTFRELNVLKERKFSLVELVHHFFTETKEICSFEDFQVVFIFDGLDECRLPLDFHNDEILTDVTESTSVDVLLTNLIRGKLLPFAHLWITTRPAAANQIPPDFIDIVTEIRGFSDPQKEEYFRKRFRDEEQASRIISHIKTSRSLHIMCHIPVFCWITATVLEDVLKTRKGGELPTTLTEMYIYFLVVQTKVKRVKYDGGAETDPHWSPENRKMIESLGKLAYDQLQKGNLIFYESDLSECGIDITAASVYSGMFTLIFKEERGLYQETMFSFVHLSVQEFLAALHVRLTFINSGVDLIEDQRIISQKCEITEYENAETHLCWRAVDIALQSPNGHLDLFLRFLLGLSLQTNQKLLRGLIRQTKNHFSYFKTVSYIKAKISDTQSADKIINLFHCLNELNDHSLKEEIHNCKLAGRLSVDILSPAQWSALAFILLSSEDLGLFDLKKYSASEEVLLRLLPVVKASKNAIVSVCDLTSRSCEALSSVLSSQSSCLRELDMANNNLQDSGMKLLYVGLASPHCNLETLRLSDCGLSWRSCEALSSVLSSQSSSLRELDLSNNDLKDSGVKKLCDGLKNPGCKLENLRLSSCLVTEQGCASLATSVTFNPSHLRKLDLSYNHPGEVGIKLLSAGLENPDWKLDTLRMEPAGEQWLRPGLRKYSYPLTIDTNTVNRKLKLLDNNRMVTCVSELQSYPDHPDRFDGCPQLLCGRVPTDRCYWEVERTGDVVLAVSYRGISRKGGGIDCRFGENDQSWCLYCYADRFSVWHNNKQTLIFSSSSSSVSNRVAVYVDCPAGTLSFYRVSSDSLIHLHTFNTIFTQPLYPGFAVWSGSSMVIRHL